MRMKMLPAAFLPALLVACGGSSTPEARSPESTGSASAIEPMAGEPAPAAAAERPPVGEPPPEPLTDEQIAAVTDAANTSEIDQAKLAQQRSVHARVRNFANMMIAHHSQAKQEQADLLKRLNVTEAESRKSAAMRDEADRTLKSLEMVSGAEFDRAYIDVQVNEHQHVLDAINDELIPNVHNDELKAELEDLRPRVEAHLSEARDIQRMLESTPATVGVR